MVNKKRTISKRTSEKVTNNSTHEIKDLSLKKDYNAIVLTVISIEHKKQHKLHML